MGLLGPSFETPAEVQLYASWGMHAVGMSTVWEAIALKHSGAKVAGLSLISNLGAGMTDQLILFLDFDGVMHLPTADRRSCSSTSRGWRPSSRPFRE